MIILAILIDFCSFYRWETYVSFALSFYITGFRILKLQNATPAKNYILLLIFKWFFIIFSQWPWCRHFGIEPIRIKYISYRLYCYFCRDAIAAKTFVFSQKDYSTNLQNRMLTTEWSTHFAISSRHVLEIAKWGVRTNRYAPYQLVKMSKMRLFYYQRISVLLSWLRGAHHAQTHRTTHARSHPTRRSTRTQRQVTTIKWWYVYQ